MGSTTVNLHRCESPAVDPAFLDFDPRTVEGQLIKNHRGRRDVLRIIHPTTGRPLFLKRTYKPYVKDVLRRWVRFRRFVGTGEAEAIHAELLEQVGIAAARGVCFGSERGWLGERFTYIVCEAAEGLPLDDLLVSESNPCRRRKLIREAAELVARLHQAGLAFPDLFGRHIFVTWTEAGPQLKLIDVYRIESHRRVSLKLRARDLAALNISVPRYALTKSERIRFLRAYCSTKSVDRPLINAITRRGHYLLENRRQVRFNERPAV